MPNASIIGWGSACPAVLSNDDLATFLETSDEWIASRTGIIARAPYLARVARRAGRGGREARARLRRAPEGHEVELIVFGRPPTTTSAPNQASGLQRARRRGLRRR